MVGGAAPCDKLAGDNNICSHSVYLKGRIIDVSSNMYYRIYTYMSFFTFLVQVS